MANTVNCKAKSYVDCDHTTCSKQETLSVEFTLAMNKATVAMYSVVAEDKKATVTNKNGVVGFLINAKGKTVSGEKVEILGSGHVLSDHTFVALIDGVQYEGVCH